MKSSAFAFAALLAAQTASAQLVSERPEPNNSAATATFLPLGQQAFGTLDSSNTDQDWYKITLTAPADLMVWTGAGRNYAAQVRTARLTLYAGNGTSQLGEWEGDDLVHGYYASFVRNDLAPGDYYIGVSSWAPGFHGGYSLDVVAGPVDSLTPYTRVATNEPDDPRTLGQATTTALNSINTGYALIGGFGDRNPLDFGVDYDLFALPLTGRCHVDFELLQSNEPGAMAAPVMHLLDAGFASILSSQPVGQGGVLERMSFDATGAGYYYVCVFGLNRWDAGIYSLRIKGLLREGPEQNDPRRPGGVATITALDTIQTGSTSTGGVNDENPNNPYADYDWYEFDLTGPCIVTFDTLRGYGPFPYQFPIMHLFDSSYGLLATSFSMGGEVLERISHAFAHGGRYYIAVSGWGATDVGAYKLRITGPSRAPATTTTTPSNCAGSAGVPSLAALDGGTSPYTYPERPVLGSTYALTGANLPANAPLFRLIGLLARPVPFDLGNFGAPGCFVFVDPMSSELAFADATGQYHWALALPMNLQLIGLPLEQQVLAYDPPANALGLTTSSRVASVCGTGH